MTAFARKVLGGLPRSKRRRRGQQLFDRAGVHQRHRQGRRQSRFQISPTLSVFGRYGWRDLDTNDQPPIPLPSGGGGNGNIYARNKQLRSARPTSPNDRSLLEVRFGWSNTRAARTLRRSDRPAH